MRFYPQLFIFTLFFWSLISCKGTTGEPGPVGPQGPAGAQGPAGSSASSATRIDFTTQPSDWTFNENEVDFFAYTFSKAMPQITEEVYNANIILVYQRKATGDPATTAWKQWPFDLSGSLKVGNPPQATYFSERSDFSYVVGRLYLRYKFQTSHPDLSKPIVTSQDNLFRIVIIPTTVGGRKEAIDYSNYALVKNLYNLPD